MLRREFITLIGGAAIVPLLPPSVGQAQQPGQMRHIAVLFAYGEDDPEADARIKIFEQALQDLGWAKDKNVQIVYRFGAAVAERLKDHALELVRQNPDVLVAQTGAALAPLRRATKTIPIVAATVGDLVDSGYVQSLARPGGNITGFPAFDLDMGGKWVELLHEIAPATRRILVLENINTQRASFLPKIEIAAKQFDISIAMPALSSEPEIGPAIDHFAREPGGGLIVLPTPFTSTHRHPIISAAARNRLPAIYPFRFFAEDGGLIVYGSDGRDIFRRAASYVDRILRGEKPENLPIQQPTKFEMIVNLKTARSLGLSVPPTLITTADEVIE